MRVAAGVVVLFALACFGGSVQTRDGRKVEGELRLKGERIIVTTSGRETQSIPLSDVREAIFREAAAEAPTSRPVMRVDQGLLGEYFGDQELRERLCVRVDPTINFRWEFGKSPQPLIPNGFSVRWTGRVRAKFSEVYTFITTTDDGARLWIDGRLLIDKWIRQEAADWTASVRLEAGRMYDIRLEYFNNMGHATAALSWQSPSQPRQIIPAECLIPAKLPTTQPAGRGISHLAVSIAAIDGGGDLLRLIESPAGGVRAEYFGGVTGQEPVFTRRDRCIDLAIDREEGLNPDPLLAGDFGVRWSGRIVPRRSGLQKIHLDIEGAARLWLGGKLVVNQPNRQPKFYIVEVPMKVGVPCDFRLEFRHSGNRGLARLGWSSSAEPWQIIPQECLLPPAGDDAAPPVVAIMRPREGDVFTAPPLVMLEPAVDDADGDVAAVRFFDGADLIGEAKAAPFHFAWRNPRPGKHALRAIAVDRHGYCGLSDRVGAIIADNGGGTFPAGWANQPIGEEELSSFGSASLADDTFTIAQAGGDLFYGHGDSCHFAYRTLNGDGQVIARLSRLHTSDGAFGTAGIMIRSSMHRESPRACLLASSDGIAFSRRSHQTWRPNNTEQIGRGVSWLKLLRWGNEVRAYTSADGKEWTLLGADRIDLGRDVLVGFAAASTDKHTPCIATFDHVSITPGTPPLDCRAKGFFTRSGTFIAADVDSLDGRRIRFHCSRIDGTFAAADVARIAFAPLMAEVTAHPPPGKSGVLLANGDFVEGEVRSIADGRISLRSVLFGARSIAIDNEVLAVVLREIKPTTPGILVETADGSIYRGGRIDASEGQIAIDDVSLGKLRIAMDQVLRIACRDRN